MGRVRSPAFRKGNDSTPSFPSEQVLWLILGMALFRNEPIGEVARRLNICAQGLATNSLLAKSGVSEARKRLGAAPVAELFRTTGQHWGTESYDEEGWQGLQVFAVDGSLLRTPESQELREHFGSGNTGTKRQTPFPMLRLVALMNVHTHVIIDAEISPYRSSEMHMATNFMDKIPDRSITLFDKAYWGADFLWSLANQGHERHWLIPAKSNIVSREVERYSEHDCLVEMQV